MNNRINKQKAELDNESIYLKYLALGDGRTISQLSAMTGKSENALYKLQSRYNWKERLENDSKSLAKNLSIAEIGDMESSELLAATNRATIEKLALFVQHAQPTSLRDAQILSSIYNIVKTEKEPEQCKDNPINLLDVIEETLPKEYADMLIRRLDELARENRKES